jgi:hypothetical protein
MKNVLFLAPGYQYAQTVIKNLSSELDRKKIPYIASKAAVNMYVRTDKVNVEIVYMDPVRWTHELFMERDAIFGKKELVEKARKTFMRMHIPAYDVSLSRYIREVHMDTCYDDVKTPTSYLPEITKVHFNPPMTIVLWSDGTKTMVKCQDGDIYSEEVGLSLCITKKALGNMPNFNNVFRKWIPEKVADSSDVDKFAYQSYIYSACNNPAQVIGDKIHKIVENFLKEKSND